MDDEVFHVRFLSETITVIHITIIEWKGNPTNKMHFIRKQVGKGSQKVDGLDSENDPFNEIFYPQTEHWAQNASRTHPKREIFLRRFLDVLWTSRNGREMVPAPALFTGRSLNDQEWTENGPCPNRVRMDEFWTSYGWKIVLSNQGSLRTGYRPNFNYVQAICCIYLYE